MAGGQAIGAMIGSGGTELVSSGGAGNGAVISSGGTQTVLLGGSAIGATVSEGGNENVLGAAQTTLVELGGMLTVSSGGQANAMLRAVGRLGTGDVGRRALWRHDRWRSARDLVRWRCAVGHGRLRGRQLTLQLDSNKFRAKIEGFTAHDAIDLLAIAYNSGTTTLGYLDNGTGSGGTLTVSDGMHIARLSMIGAYGVENFTLSDDGHGGTMITDPPVSSGAGIATPH